MIKKIKFIYYCYKLNKTVNKINSSSGCSWTYSQNNNSLAKYLIEEAYECSDSLQNGTDYEKVDELSDILYQVILNSSKKQNNKQFDINSIIKHLNNKLTIRHPYAFQKNDLTPKQINDLWQKNKSKKNYLEKFKSTPKNLPALIRARKYGEIASSFGFEWDDINENKEKIKEEVDEFLDATELEHTKEELGDLFFVLAQFARLNNWDAEEILNNGNNKFLKRIIIMDEIAKNNLNDKSIDELNLLWDQAKIKIKNEKTT